MRLEVSKQADLAIRALVTLGANGHRMSAPKLAALLGTTGGFMSQVMNPLVKAGWVSSEPGRNGGYLLERDLAELTLLDLVELVDGPIDDGMCIVAGVPCESHEHCPMHSSWSPARWVLVEHLGRRTLDRVNLGY